MKFNQETASAVIALAGNPNVGKSTVFNALTGLNQHTGNWPGKTVEQAVGTYMYKGLSFTLVDLPGTYSLLASSPEEEVARDYLCSGEADLTVVVADATCLERNLNLVLQVLMVSSRVILCVNLLDEAKKKRIQVDLNALAQELGIPVVGVVARSNKNMDRLRDEIAKMAAKTQQTPNMDLTTEGVDMHGLPAEPSEGEIGQEALLSPSAEGEPRLCPSCTSVFTEELAEETIRQAGEIYSLCVQLERQDYNARDRRLDRILTSKALGFPIMILLLAIIFWITITGANYPSAMLSDLLFGLQDHLYAWATDLNIPLWLKDPLILGVYRTLAWVVSVMLPPMAIFFPLFTLLEDFGYLPRVAFNMDHFFRKACAHGKQMLTMCMSFGCNACGIIGCRIIDSPRERLIALLTNNFIPCNGRFPTLISIIAMFFAGMMVAPWRGIVSALLLTAVILLGITFTLLLSKFLSKTLLKGMPSSFALELPPYRRPRIGQVIVRSVLDRTLFVLGRAVVVAAPAGLVIWLLANIYVGDVSILQHCTDFLDPFARLIGLDGVILMAFILGFPANEIVVPIIIMTYLATGSLLELETAQLHTLLIDNGWTVTTAVCTMLFCLMHFPCGTSCLTIKKETQSWKWTAAAFAIPTVTGILVCFVVAQVMNFFLV